MAAVTEDCRIEVAAGPIKAGNAPGSISCPRDVATSPWPTPTASGELRATSQPITAAATTVNIARVPNRSIRRPIGAQAAAPMMMAQKLM